MNNFLSSSEADENLELLLWRMIDMPVDQGSSATTPWVLCFIFDLAKFSLI